jgi:hypothetical protein
MKLSDIILEGTRKIPPTDKFEIKVPNRKQVHQKNLYFLEEI